MRKKEAERMREDIRTSGSEDHALSAPGYGIYGGLVRSQLGHRNAWTAYIENQDFVGVFVDDGEAVGVARVESEP
jgi:hypothetical protein